MPLAAISNAHKLFTARLTCLEDRMVINVKYNYGTFTGIAYTEGSYDDAQCVKRIEKEKEFQFVVRYDECKTTADVRTFKGKFDERTFRPKELSSMCSSCSIMNE